jgi:hypothetical protein
MIDRRGRITERPRLPTITSCPVYLAASRWIDTPTGDMGVQELCVGDVAWLADVARSRRTAVILKTVRVLVPADHPMVHVILSDGVSSELHTVFQQWMGGSWGISRRAMFWPAFTRPILRRCLMTSHLRYSALGWHRFLLGARHINR